MDYVNPMELVQEALRVAKKKAALSAQDLLLRGFLAGAFLAYATSLVMIVLSQGLPPIVGALLFPVGFVMLVLLGLELATGNFALLPAALAAREVPFGKLLRNWGWVYLGNVIGSVFYAVLFYLAVTNCGTSGSGALGDLLKQAAQKKTLGYMALGTSGFATAFVKGILCNWMVTIGTVLAMVVLEPVARHAGKYRVRRVLYGAGVVCDVPCEREFRQCCSGVGCPSDRRDQTRTDGRSAGVVMKRIPDSRTEPR